MWQTSLIIGKGCGMSDNASFAFTFWGVRGSTPCANKENMEYGGNTTCVQIHIPDSDELLILDCGTGVRNLGQQLCNQEKKHTGRIFVTHPHWDHIQGFPFFRPIYNSANAFDIHMPPQKTGGCEQILSGHLSKTFFPVSLDMIDADLSFHDQSQSRTSYHHYDVEYMQANHSINTAIYKFYLGQKTVVFAPDNELIPQGYAGSDGSKMEAVKKFIYGADVLIHDAQYSRTSYKNKQGWGHSAWQETVSVAKECKVKKLFLTHHDPCCNDGLLNDRDQKLEDRYGSHFDLITLAREGETITI